LKLLIYLYERGKSPRAAKTAELKKKNSVSGGGERERQRE
jgi:hypothetical protein